MRRRSGDLQVVAVDGTLRGRRRGEIDCDVRVDSSMVKSVWCRVVVRVGAVLLVRRVVGRRPCSGQRPHDLADVLRDVVNVVHHVVRDVVNECVAVALAYECALCVVVRVARCVVYGARQRGTVVMTVRAVSSRVCVCVCALPCIVVNEQLAVVLVQTGALSGDIVVVVMVVLVMAVAKHLVVFPAIVVAMLAVVVTLAVVAATAVSE